MIFFHVNSHHRNGHLQKITEIHIKGEFVKIRESTLVIIFMIFHSKITILAWKSKFIYFPEFSLLIEFLEKDKLEALLKSAQIELQNYELFKQQVDEEKLIAIQNVETNLKSHYDESVKYQLNELKSKLNGQFEQER